MVVDASTSSVSWRSATPTPAEIPVATSPGGLRVGKYVIASGNIDFCLIFSGNGGWGIVDHERG